MVFVLTKKINLGLFFTKGNSLESWKNSGLLQREKLLYEHMLQKGDLYRVFWFTYGKNDGKIAEDLMNNYLLNKHIHVVPIPKILSNRLGQWIYSLIIFFVHYDLFRKIDILKSNQLYGSWAPLIVKFFTRKPFILRTGYVLSLYYNRNILLRYFFLTLERLVFHFADISVVSNTTDFEYVKKKYKKKEIRLNPSFVDTSLFNKNSNEKNINPTRLLFVGRLSKVKNLINTIEGALASDFSIDIYGDGLQKYEIKKKFMKNIDAGKVRLMGVLSNDKLAYEYKKYKFYILISHLEGMSKTLMEAMASGLVCIVSKIPQNESLIKHGETGILVNGSSKKDISNALEELNQFNLNEISKNAEKFISSNFSLPKICQNELNNINEVLK